MFCKIRIGNVSLLPEMTELKWMELSPTQMVVAVVMDHTVPNILYFSGLAGNCKVYFDLMMVVVGSVRWQSVRDFVSENDVLCQ